MTRSVTHPRHGNALNEPVPTLIDDGLAMYATGERPPRAARPVPHGFVTGPTAAGPSTARSSGWASVLTFHLPGGFASRRSGAHLDLDEMTGCCTEAVARLGVAEPVPVAGQATRACALFTWCSSGPGW